MQAVQHQQPGVAEGYATSPENHHGYCGKPPQHQVSSSPVPKNVAFELLLDGNSKVRARIPMRVQIFPHDTTDSIVTTVKNFYGIYEGAASGVSFEDEHGITLIARYENLRNNMTVYVRVIPVHTYGDGYGEHYYGSVPVEARKRPSLGEPFQMAPSQLTHVLEYACPPSLPTSRVARKRSASPPGRGRRSASQHKGPSRSNKSRGSSAHGSFSGDGIAGYSDSDGGHGSITGSKKARSEQFASSDISMDNILQDGRRKRPKFESSELPLFVPPQVPLTTSTSSISPQRRSTGQEEPSPFARPAHRPYNVQQPLPSPQSFGHNEQAHGTNSAWFPPYTIPRQPEHDHRLRDRPVPPPSGLTHNPAIRHGGPGILPTPDPTIASCISDEDVAMQLIRLGDASNFSHGRNSASTLDDAFSGAADASSSTGATSDGGDFSENEEGEHHPRSKQKFELGSILPPGSIKRTYKQLNEVLPDYEGAEPSDDEGNGDHCQGARATDQIKTEYDEHASYIESAPKAKKVKTKATSSSAPNKPRGPRAAPAKPNKNGKNRSGTMPRKLEAAMAAPAHPKVSTSTQAASTVSSRKLSGSAANLQHQLTVDEEDLSTKPRCQRCRKSKKGCDRQRPCGRCRDAGIGLEGCISEDEGNGRKGRYGRHMGVPVRKLMEVAPITNNTQSIGTPFASVPSAMPFLEKNKKRKR